MSDKTIVQEVPGDPVIKLPPGMKVDMDKVNLGPGPQVLFASIEPVKQEVRWGPNGSPIVEGKRVALQCKRRDAHFWIGAGMVEGKDYDWRISIMNAPLEVGPAPESIMPRELRDLKPGDDEKFILKVIKLMFVLAFLVGFLILLHILLFIVEIAK